MIMKQKEKLLLRYLIDHKKEYVTSQRLASELLLSDRTIRNYLQRIKELVEKTEVRSLLNQVMATNCIFYKD